MIEELKLVLETLGDLGASAVWLAVGFLLFKLVMYLSTTGAVVFIAKLLIERVHSVMTQKKEPEPVRDVQLQGICITHDGTYDGLIGLIRSLSAQLNESRTSGYFFKHNLDWLSDAVAEKFARESQGKKEGQQ